MYLSVLYFVTALLGFLTFSVVLAQYKTNNKVNFYLAVLLFISACRFFFGGVRFLIPFAICDNFMIALRSLGFMIFPCFYLYFKNLILNEKGVDKNDLHHFIIPVAFVFVNFLVRQYAMYLHICVYFLFIGLALFYFSLSFVELKNKIWFRNSETEIVDVQWRLMRNWTIFVFVVCVLCVLRLLITLVFDVYVAGYSDGTNCFWLSAILCCILYFKILLTPVALHKEVGRVSKINQKEHFELVFSDFWTFSTDFVITNSQDLRLKERIDVNLVNYIHEIEKKALEHMCFRNPSVSMRDFAIKLGIPKSHLIYLFKYHCEVSFIEFKKTVRIYDAISLIEEGFLQSAAVMCLSKKTGFSSFNVFMASFKEITGVSPQQYNKMIEE